MERHGFATLAVYADRERFANMAFLTGYEPRFEEALLLVSQSSTLLLVGNEGYGYAQSVAILPGLELGLCPTFSLYGQPRDLTDKGKSLTNWLMHFGIGPDGPVGVVGAKVFSEEEFAAAHEMTDVPVFVVRPIKELVGHPIRNASDLLIHPSTGLRAGGEMTSAHDIAAFDYAAEKSYSGVRNLLANLNEGMSEEQAASLLGFSGFPPLAYHLALGFGERHANAGLGSPDPLTELKIGDPVTFGFGLWGANVARTGFGVHSESELPLDAKGYIDELAEPYFRCLKDWYEALSIGTAGGAVQSKVSWFTDDPRYAVGLNPGHLLHLDEWPATPFYKNSEDKLNSGMFIQCDIIPAPGAPLYGIHTEDGVVLADARLRSSLKKEFPRVYARIERRRALVASLGINLAEEVLPLSSMQACVQPFLLDAGRVICG
jgi:hypothetical protein